MPGGAAPQPQKRTTQPERKKNIENPRGGAMCGRCEPSIGDLKWGGHQHTESLEQRAPMAASA